MNMDDFYEKYIAKECLPEEYGGLLPPVPELHEENTKKLSELKDFFKEEEMQRDNHIRKFNK